MIVATAGHVDHGKTALLKQLTGIDTDRLAEEKARGLSIDLGFAYTPLPGGDILGFVDVPGHERFVTNMLAGVGAIDFALLVVAADDGVMPQTREHLAILNLLAIPEGVIALTKSDRVDAERLSAVQAEVGALVAGTNLADAAIFPVSSITGEGVAALREHLAAAARMDRPRRDRGNFRLAIDRRFTIQGAGLVVTGAAFSGVLSVGDQVVLSPQGKTVRVRGIHAQDRRAETGHAGERLALNLAGSGIEKSDIRRGDWIVAEPAHNPATRLDARIRVLAGEDHPLKHNAPVHVHLGAADIPGRIAVLDGRRIMPGQSGFAQIVLDRPVIAVHGDRLVLRDQSARRTIGGGRVIDPFGPARGRARADRLAILKAMQEGTPKAIFEALLERAAEGVDLQWLARALNLTPDEAEALYAESEAAAIGKPSARIAFAPAHWQALSTDILETVTAWHRQHPDRTGIPAPEIRKCLPRRISAPVIAAAAGALVAGGDLRRDGETLSLPGHSATVKDEEAALWQRIVPFLEEKGPRPPTVHEIADSLETQVKTVISCLARIKRSGTVIQVSASRFFLPEAVFELAHMAEEVAGEAAGGLFTVRAFRDRAGIGRNASIEVLEYFDRVGLTRRQGNERRLVRSVKEVFERAR